MNIVNDARDFNGFIKHYTCHSSFHSPSLYQKNFVGNSKQNQWQVLGPLTRTLICSQMTRWMHLLDCLLHRRKTPSRKFWKWGNLRKNCEKLNIGINKGERSFHSAEFRNVLRTGKCANWSENIILGLDYENYQPIEQMHTRAASPPYENQHSSH